MFFFFLKKKMALFFFRFFFVFFSIWKFNILFSTVIVSFEQLDFVFLASACTVSERMVNIITVYI